MGVRLSTLEFFNRSISLTIGSIAGKRMAELGDQKLHAGIALKPDGSRVWFKDWVEARGCHHYSIDIHGKNGSYPLDLSKPIEDKFWHGNFDIITNFGTSEHVSEQVCCWKNIHRFGKPGSIYIHVLPEFGKYPLTHSKYFYDAEFFKWLITKNKYMEVSVESLHYIGHIGACYIKPCKGEFVFDAGWIKEGD